ncbi:hypothetical protein [Neorhodopirellula lusitana]|nr:hypothetical protein [Neorhodopirellula lusitana]
MAKRIPNGVGMGAGLKTYPIRVVENITLGDRSSPITFQIEEA